MVPRPFGITLVMSSRKESVNVLGFLMLLCMSMLFVLMFYMIVVHMHSTHDVIRLDAHAAVRYSACLHMRQ